MRGLKRRRSWRLPTVVLSAMVLFALAMGPVLANGPTSSWTASDSSQTRQREAEPDTSDSAGEPGYANADPAEDGDELYADT